jgi:hypothetical protein
MDLKSILTAEFVLTCPLSASADRNKHKEATQFVCTTAGRNKC